MFNVIGRINDGKASPTIKELTNHFSSLELDIVDNGNIGKSALAEKVCISSKEGLPEGIP